MVQLKNSRNIRNRYKPKRTGRGIICVNCPEQKELNDETPINGDDNLKKLSEHLKKLNVKQPKYNNKNYIKF